MSELTLTYWTAPSWAADRLLLRYRFREDAEAVVNDPHSRRLGISSDDIQEVTHTYRVGQSVMVDAFGRWRTGKVVKLNRTTVTVEYQRNQQGTLATKAFNATLVRPVP